MLPNERATTCAQFLQRACQWFHDQHGITARLPMDQRQRGTVQPHLQNRWAFRTPWTSDDERTEALADFLIFYNAVRGHDSLGGNTPISRLTA